MDNPIFLNGEGGFCFISHSFYDFKKVREIRNILEENGINPLCFFLKCMTDEDEIDGMLRREIEAREIFVLADSQNSRKSKAVQKEIEIINSLGRSYFKINLDTDESPQALAEQIMQRMQVFISCSSRNHALSHRFKIALMRRDLRVFHPIEDMPIGSNFVEVITDMIRTASEYGCVLLLLTPDSVQSNWFEHELMYALKHHATIFPVLVGDVKLSDSFRFLLHNMSAIHISSDPSEAELNEVCDRIHAFMNRRHQH